MLSKTITLNLNVKLEKGADYMNLIIFHICMMAGAVLVEQVVNATKVMRVEELNIRLAC